MFRAKGFEVFRDVGLVSSGSPDQTVLAVHSGCRGGVGGHGLWFRV